MFVIKITEPAKLKVSGTPSLLNIWESVFQHILLVFLESSAALSMFKLKSSNKILSQSSNTKTLSAPEKL